MKLQVPKRYFGRDSVRDLRPTKAIVRKSVFQRLEPLEGKQVCDLYAGIGTLGIEALSRGADHVTFVENDRQAVSILNQNLTRVKAEDRSAVAMMDVVSFLGATPGCFDVILADPPYNSIEWTDLHPLVRDVLAPGGLFVMELPRSAPLPGGIDVRAFGKTKVGLWRKAE
ncbi:MAG: RsmD family RNA methyltransferase [Fidelibacterota bacterium]|nr:MAG: RsmD family RNA methyltransferase [Candidatus Neomarinimicrobiota bacterium]